MKRSIPRSLVSKATNLDTNKERASDSEGRTESSDAVSTPFKGAGSAWKSGALAQSQAAVERSRAELCSGYPQRSPRDKPVARSNLRSNGNRPPTRLDVPGSLQVFGKQHRFERAGHAHSSVAGGSGLAAGSVGPVEYRGGSIRDADRTPPTGCRVRARCTPSCNTCPA